MKIDTTRMGEDPVAKDQAFQKFLDQPTTKFVLSFIPPGKEVEALRVALRAAFDAGYECGGGQCASGLLRTIMEAERDRKR